MENISQMPRPTPGNDPYAYTACCEFCGQGIAITCREKNPTAAQLIDAATEQCQCDGARRKRIAKRAEEVIPKIFGKDCSPIYGGPVDENVLPWIKEAALLIATDHLSGITIKLNDQEAATLKGGWDSVEITRTRKKQTKTKI